MRPLALIPLLLLAGCGTRMTPVPAAAPTPAPDAPAARAAGFDRDAVATPPVGFALHSHGPGRPARWQVLAAADAPSAGNVLAQLDDDDTNHRFNLALMDAAVAADVRVAVTAKAVAGKRDRSFGVVARWQDGDTYYLARCNTSDWGPNVRIYRFTAGKREELAEAPVAAKPDEWHKLALEVRGDRLSAIFDGQVVAEARDAAIPGSGRCGVWTKAESVSWFDDVTVTPLK